MPTLHDVLSGGSTLSSIEVDWLHQLVGDWQMVADLSFADLTLWVTRTQPDSLGHTWVLAAHARPSTGPNFYSDDVVGVGAPAARAGVLDTVADTGRSHTHQPSEFAREQYVPVRRGGAMLGVLVRHTDLHHMRQQGGLEVNYLQIAQSLLVMIAQGTFPADQPQTGIGRGTPRVGDGVLRLSADGLIEYASPNAVSALRRLGHTAQVLGADLSAIVTSQIEIGTPVDETTPLVLTGRAPWGTEIETRGLHLTMRAVPLHARSHRVGALLLLRDVSELRRQERELVTKDATIREVHHRVKNNLQTVSALLRLQSRRMNDPAAKAALAEAGRRLTTVAMVHDTLSHGLDETADFDQVALRILRATVEVASSDTVVSGRLSGSFGVISAQNATPLAMVLAELVHNAVQHGFPARSWTAPEEAAVEVWAQRSDDDRELRVWISDNGVGLPQPEQRPRSSGLGIQIVESLLTDLRGTLTWQSRPPHGTCVSLTAQLQPLPES